MWIKTQGGYLLNLDKVEYIRWDGNHTLAYTTTLRHIVSTKNILDNISDNIIRGTKIMEVR